MKLDLICYGPIGFPVGLAPFVTVGGGIFISTG